MEHSERMWQRKTEKELKELRHRRRVRNLLWPIGAGVLAMGVVFFASMITGGRGEPGPVSVKEALRRLPIGFVLGFLCGVFGLLVLGLDQPPRTLLCPERGSVKQHDGELCCPCGGRFEPLRDWTWVDDDESRNGSTPDPEGSGND